MSVDGKRLTLQVKTQKPFITTYLKMAKTNNQDKKLSSVENSTDNLTSIGTKLQANKKIIMVLSAIGIIVVSAILIYVFLIRRPAQQRAATQAGLGFAEMMKTQGVAMDSVTLDKTKKRAEDYFKSAANLGHDGGNISYLMLAEAQYEDGKYKEALANLEKFNPTDEIMGAAAISLKADCQVNLDLLNDAVNTYKKAISRSGDNPYYTPFFMMKLARVYAEQKKHGEALAVYQEIYDKYPQYFGNNIQELEKMIALEKAQTNTK